MSFHCSLDAGDLADQSAEWRRLSPAVVEKELHADRFRLVFDDRVYDQVAALVATEQGCCSWARWDLARRDDDRAVLEVSGPADQIAALAHAFGLAPA